MKQINEVNEILNKRYSPKEINSFLQKHNENPVLKDKDISLVVSNYSLGGGAKGKLAIIGPTRMDYAKVISTLDYLTACINEALEKEGE